MLRNKPLNFVLIKPAGPDCNMECDYCFYLKKARYFNKIKTHRMSYETLEEVIKQVMTQGGRSVNFGWQGGEPTLMGVDFFTRAVEFQDRYGSNQDVANGIQTNGILLNRDWARLFREYNFLVGISIDGPRHIHDRYRKMKGGGSSWEKVLNSAEMLLEEGVDLNSLIVVNDYSVQFPDEIYEFNKSIGITYMQFIPCVEPDPDDPKRTAYFSVDPDEYGKFLKRLFDLWWEDFEDDRPKTSIRFFESLFYHYVGLEPPMCTLLKECGNYVVVEHNGDLFSCDFFVDSKHRLGNIHEQLIVEMLNSEQQDRFGKEKKNVHEDCQSCEWLIYCRGGCLKDRLNNPHRVGLSYFCSSYRMFFPYAHQRLTGLADRWRRERIKERIERSPSLPKRNDPCPCGSGLKYKHCCGSLQR